MLFFTHLKGKVISICLWCSCSMTSWPSIHKQNHPNKLLVGLFLYFVYVNIARCRGSSEWKQLFLFLYSSTSILQSRLHDCTEIHYLSAVYRFIMWRAIDNYWNENLYVFQTCCFENTSSRWSERFVWITTSGRDCSSNKYEVETLYVK